jgi:thiol-disulfide isomerase/thioredoxin
MAKYVNFNQALPIGGEESFISRMQNAGSNMSSTTITIIAAVILFAILAAFYYFYYLAPQMNAQYKPNSEQVGTGADESKNAELLFFYADWCPHKTINGYRVVFTDVNCSEETAEVDKMMNQYNIEGYPTIKLIKDGQVIEYDAKPSKDTLTQFLNTVL